MESRLLGFPCFPYSVICMACFWRSVSQVPITATLCEMARRSEDRLQNHPAIRDERHEEAQQAAQDHGRELAVLDVHPDEY